MNKFNFKNSKIDLVGKRKIWFFVPVCVFVLALIMGIIYGVAFGNPLNLSMDFSGGYSLTVTIGPNLTGEKQADYEEQIREVFETLENANGVPYGLAVESFAKQGQDDTAGLYVKYKAVASDNEMETINEELEDALLAKLFVGDKYAGRVTPGDSVSATVSSELLITALCAILLSIVLMLIYIAIRFELLSGIASIVCLTHDVLIMFALMVIFQIPLSSTFIAALITILGYSINNTIIIFDRVRDILKTSDGSNMSYNQIANNAIKTTMVRSINTTTTTLITVVMVTIFSLIFLVEDMVFFCLPLIFGLLAGTFSSVLLAPSIWTMWKERQSKKTSKLPYDNGTPGTHENKTPVTELPAETTTV